MIQMTIQIPFIHFFILFFLMYPYARSNLRLVDINGRLDVFSFISTIDSSNTIHCSQGVSYPSVSPRPPPLSVVVRVKA